MSRRAFMKLAVQAVGATALTACADQAPNPESPTRTEIAPTPTVALRPTPTAVPTPTPVVADLREMIGQMLLVGFRGLRVDESHPTVRDIRESHLGGVVLFDIDGPTGSTERNIQSPVQLKALVEELQSFSNTPLIVAIDQEGGQVRRLKERAGFPPTVSARYLGALGDPAETYEHAAVMAKAMAEAGINLNLAPVVDLNTNQGNPVIGRFDRSFSADPDVVTVQALAFIRAHHDAGVLTTLKHFPGHGSSSTDSHRGSVDVTATWARDELDPYRGIIERAQVDAIMTAHVFNSDLDPAYPATLSSSIISRMLREQLAYDGVVISDDLQMAAITEQFSRAEAVERAILAGLDIIAFANSTIYEERIVPQTVDLIERLVRDGQISHERIRKSYERIWRLKRRLLEMPA